MSESLVETAASRFPSVFKIVARSFATTFQNGEPLERGVEKRKKETASSEETSGGAVF